MRIGQLAVVLSMTVLVGCAHQFALTAGGAAVQRVDRTHLPDGCRVVGDVSIGIPPDAAVAATEAELEILMRNKAAGMGADHIVVEQSELRPGADGVGHYVGSGSAYVCTPVTSGGEESLRPADEGPSPDATPPPI